MRNPNTMVKRYDRGPCVLCGRLAYSVYGGGAASLKDAPVCGACVRKLRTFYPMEMERMKDGQPKGTDPLESLTVDEARQVLEEFPERIEELRAQYAPYHAVFQIRAFHTEKQGLLKPPMNYFDGACVLGRFNWGETVKLLHGGSTITLTLEEIGDPFPLLGKAGQAGYQATLKAAGKGISAESGDLIVKE